MRLNKSLPARAASQFGWANVSGTWLAPMPALVCIALLFAPVPVVFGQMIEVPRFPEPINDSDAARTFNAGTQAESAPLSTSEIPLFTYQIFASRDGKTYRGSMVGGSPFSSKTNNKTQKVKFVIVPVVLKFVFGTGSVVTFSPIAGDRGCLGAGNTALSLTTRSPLFHPVSFTMNGEDVGDTTYPDAFRRAEFFTKVGPNYHLTFSVKTLTAQTVKLVASDSPSAHATVYHACGLCGTNTGNTNIPGALGVVDINTFDPIAQRLIRNLKLNPCEFPFFVFYNSVLSQGNATLDNCCILGYHNSETGRVTNPGQTYGVAEFEGRDQTAFTGVSDISVMTHEVDEWINDPSGNNLVPAWGDIGQQPGCQNNLEVGDPLSGTLFPSATLHGFTYHFQELAFFSWFYGQPSIGAGGLFSNNGTFTTDAGVVCR